MSLRRLNQKERKLYKKGESRRTKIYEPQSDSESEQELAEHEKNLFFLPRWKPEEDKIKLFLIAF